jgi:tetratricopeptide (TPR) repeat protein
VAAQSAPGGAQQVWTREALPLRASPDAKGRVLERLPAGVALQVVSAEGEWYFVDGADLKRLGWVLARDVTAEPADRHSASLPTAPTPASQPPELLQRSISQSYAEVLYNLGKTYTEKRNYNKAIENYNLAVDILSQNKVKDHNELLSKIYLDRAHTYMLLEDINRAIKDYDKVIEINPKHTSAYSYRGDAKLQLGRKKEAIRDFQTSARLGHKDTQEYLRSIRINW